MTTSLASQLQQLATPQTSLLDQKRVRKSILFESSEADNYGRDVYYDIGTSGLEELVAMNKTFNEFKMTLFSPEAKGMQRAVKDKATNKILDTAIDNFLVLLSPYLEKQAALKALEWLSYRFQVCEMNRLGILMCIFPYYESPVFVRVLQTLNLQGEEWEWLQGCQKTGRPVPKATVFARWFHYQSFRTFVSKSLQKSLKIHTKDGNMKVSAAFYVSTVVGGICLQKKVTEEQMPSIMQLVPQCLSSTPDLVSGTYLILSLLATRTSLATKALECILRLLTREVEPSFQEQHVLLLLTLAHHQKLQPLPPDIFIALNKMAHIYHILKEVAKSKSVAPLLSVLLSGIIRGMVREESPLNNSANFNELEKLLKRIADFTLSPGDSANIIWSFLETVRLNLDALASFKLEVLATLEVGHPEGYSRALSRLKRAESDPLKGREYKKIFKLLVRERKDAPSSFLHLVSPNDAIRQSAASTFLDTVSRGQQREENNPKLHMTSLLCDSSPAIVLSALQCDAGLKLLDQATLVARCQAILKKTSDEQGADWVKVRGACLQVLTGDLASLYTQDLHSAVIRICLPLVLFPKSRADMVIVRMILSSNLCQREPLLARLVKKSGIILSDRDIKTQEYCTRVWSVMSTVLASLDPQQHKKFWAHFTGPETACLDKNLEEHTLLSQFMKLALLCFALEGERLAATIRLQLAHTLLDTCLSTFNNFTVLESCKLKDSRQTITSKTLNTWQLEVMSLAGIPILLLVKALQHSLGAFCLPKSCLTTPYWTLDMEGEGNDSELLLLVKAMRGTMQLDHYSKPGLALRDQLLTTIFTSCLKTSEHRFYFLSLLWGWDASLRFSHIIDDVLQLWSLKLGAAMLTSLKSSLAWTLGTSQPLVPALLASLTHTSPHIRQAVLVCISRLATIVGGRLTQSNHSLLLESVLAHREAILTDARQMGIILSALQSQAKSNCAEVTNSLTDVVVSPGLPPHLCSPLLYILTGVMHTDMLKKLLPLGIAILKQCEFIEKGSQLDHSTSLCLYYILLGLTPDTSQVLVLDQGWNFFTKAITCNQLVLNLQQEPTSPQAVIIDQVMSGKFFSSLGSEDVKCQVWRLLISRVVDSGDYREAQRLRKGLRKVVLDAQLVAEQIQELNLAEKVTTIKAAQAKRLRQKENASPDVSWRVLGLMLETIGVMASLTRPWLLVASLSQCLLSSLARDSTSADLTQQQILSALLHLLQKSVEELGEEELKKNVQINTEVMVQCIRATHSPDTQRRAMLILAFAARIDSEAVIQKVMPIFTFMGTSLMWRDDSYSFQVIFQTIQSILPTLVKCESEEPIELRLGRVCQVFVDALPDVPQHRRLTLFTKLATTLDPTRHLWIILALLADSYVMRGNIKEDVDEKRSDERRRVPADIQFALTLAAQFSGVNQTTACISLVSYVSKLPQETEDRGSDLCHLSRRQSDTKQTDIISWDLHSSRQIWHFKFTIMGLIVQILASEEFVCQVCEASEVEEGELKDLYRQLLEKTMAYLHSISCLVTKYKDKSEGRLMASVHRKVIEVMDGVNAVLPPIMLLEVIGNDKEGLLASPLPIVRCRATEIFCSKLQPGTATFFSLQHFTSIRRLSTALCTLSVKSDEPVENRQTYLIALQLIIRFKGDHMPLQHQKVLETAVDIVCSKDGDNKLQTQALVLVTECVMGAKAHVVTVLARFMPTLTSFLTTTTHTSDNLLLQAAVTATHKLVEIIPNLLSPYLVGVVSGLCGLWSSTEESGRITARVLAAQEAIATTVEPRVLIPTLQEAYNTLMKSDPVSVCGLMEMIEKLVACASAKIFSSYQKELLTLFTQAFNLRAKKPKCEKTDEVESSVISAVSKLLLRLNQNQNMAIFLAIWSWANKGCPTRLITFFRLADHLAGTFKVLFIKAHLAETVLDAAPHILEKNNTLHKTTMFGESNEGEGQACLLVSAVLDTLTKIFLYDSVGLTSADRFNHILTPLTDQLENMVGGDSAHSERVESHLIPCLTKLAVAVGDDRLWRTLSKHVLSRVHNDDQPQVVVGALNTFQALVESLGTDYLEPLVSDVLPYLTEALESSSTEVEERTRAVFTCMETTMGQSFKDYLT